MINPYPYEQIRRFPLRERLSRPFRSTAVYLLAGLLVGVVCPLAGAWWLAFPTWWYQTNSDYRRVNLTLAGVGAVVTVATVVAGKVPVAWTLLALAPHAQAHQWPVVAALWVAGSVVTSAPALVVAGLGAWGRCVHLDLAGNMWLTGPKRVTRSVRRRTDANISALRSGTNN